MGAPPARMSGVQKEVVRLYRALLREGKRKGGWPVYNEVRKRFAAKRGHSRTDVMSIEVWLAGAKKQLKMLQGADRVQFKRVDKKD